MQRKHVLAVGILMVCFVSALFIVSFIVFGGPSAQEVRFLKACRNGDLTTVTLMIQEKPKLVRCHDVSQISPLHEAAFGGHINIVQFLLDHGADPLACSTSGEYAFQWGHNYPEIYNLLLRKYVETGGRVFKNE